MGRKKVGKDGVNEENKIKKKRLPVLLFTEKVEERQA